MVDFPRIPGSRPYTGPTQNNTRGAEASAQPAAAPQAEAQQAENKGFLGAIGSFFQKAASTIEAWFEPVDQRVEDANFRSSSAAATSASSSSEQAQPPGLKASYDEVASYVKANRNVDYFEIERGNVNRNLSNYLTQFKAQIDANPELRQKLSQSPLGQELLASLDRIAQGGIGTNDILALQKFAVASGANIGYEGNPTGIDGQFGPKTLAGLQESFEKLLANPSTAVDTLNQGAETATRGVEALRQAQDGEIDTYTPGQSTALPDTNEAQPTGPRPVATDFGNSLVASARNVDRSMNNSGKCLKGVRLALEGAGVLLRDPRTGGNLNSAYQAADVLATQHRDRFTEMRPVSRADLRNLPPGAIVVWDRNPNPSLRAANPNNGYTHGHIEIIGENGTAYSDGRQSWGITMNNNGRYGEPRVFLPNS